MLYRLDRVVPGKQSEPVCDLLGPMLLTGFKFAKTAAVVDNAMNGYPVALTRISKAGHLSDAGYVDRTGYHRA